MLLNAIATLILAGLMLVPFVNVIVGAIVGAGLAGAPGSLLGALLAGAITAAETVLAERLGWRDVTRKNEDADGTPEIHRAGSGPSTTETTVPTVRTGPTIGRRKLPRATGAASRATRPDGGRRLGHA